MKKIFLSLFVLLFTFGLFAETGYAGVNWGAKREQLKYLFEDHPNTEDWKNTEVRLKMIQGEQTKVYYHFCDVLVGVSYTIPSSKTKKLINIFKNCIDVVTIPTMTKEEAKENLKIDFENKQESDIQINNAMFQTMAILDQKGINQSDGKGLIWIFDYNEDTRVYVIQDLIEGLTTVVYIVHEQDY